LESLAISTVLAAFNSATMGYNSEKSLKGENLLGSDHRHGNVETPPW